MKSPPPDRRVSAADIEAHGTLVAAFHHQAATRAGAPALLFRSGDRYASISWGQMAAAARRLAAYLIGEGVAEHESIAIWSGNRPEWHIADVAILSARCRPVPVYVTVSPEQVAHAVGHSDAVICIVENQRLLARLLEVRDRLPRLRRIVLIDSSGDPCEVGEATAWEVALTAGEAALARHRRELDRRSAAVEPGDVATLIYTSGTTGPPRAALLTHANVVATSARLAEIFEAGPDDRVISYLPLAHVAERMTSEFHSYLYGNPTYFLDGLHNLTKRMNEVHPTLFFGVPRVWEKLAAGVWEQVGRKPRPERWLIHWALRVAAATEARRERGDSQAPGATRAHRLAERLVLSRLRTRLGFDRCRILVSGGAPVAKSLLGFFRGLGLEICEVYGQTEDAGVTSINRPGGARLGSVGRPLPGNQVRIEADGEILVRGPGVFPGYFKDPSATADALQDRWLRTGDTGRLDADGFLHIIGRKKDLIITAGGKNISPTNIESALVEHPLIGHAVVIGDARPFVAALLTLDPDEASRLARRRGLRGDLRSQMASLAADPDVAGAIREHVASVNARFSQVERVKRWSLLPGDFSPGDELTPTLKVKRGAVVEKYRDEIEALYARRGGAD